MDRPIAGWLFLSFLLLFVATATGVMPYGDDVSMLQVTASLVQGRLDIPPDAPAARPGIDGKSYSKAGLGQSLLAIPFYLAGSAAERYWPGNAVVNEQGFAKANTIIYFVSMLGAVATASTIALLFLTCRALGFAVVPSAATAASLGLCTFAWHYARTFMTEPTSMLAVLGAYYGMVRFEGQREEKWLALSGCSAALAILLRLSNGLIVGVVAIWLVSALWPERSLDRSRIARKAILWIAPIAAALTLVGFYNAVRFGRVPEAGYGKEAYEFTTPLFVGLYGFLLSPGKSLFVYAPILIAAVLAGWPLLLRRRSAPVWYAVAITAAHVLFFSRYYVWYGGGVWGPRFLVVVLPFLLLGLAALIETRADRFFVVESIWILAALSLTIQVVSVVVPYVPYQARMNATAQSFSEFLWHPAASAVVAATASFIWREYPPDFAPVYYHSPFLAIVQLTALACSLICGARVAGLVKNGQTWRSATIGSTDAALRAGR